MDHLDFTFDDVYVVGPNPTYSAGSPTLEFNEGDRVKITYSVIPDVDGDLKARLVDAPEGGNWEYIFAGDLTPEGSEPDTEPECDGSCSVSVSALCAAAVALNADPELIENLLDLASVIEQFQAVH